MKGKERRHLFMKYVFILKDQISVKTLELVLAPNYKKKLWLDCFYSNLTKCGTRANMRNKPITLL